MSDKVVLISSEQFKNLDLKFTEIKISAFDLLLTTEDGTIYRINDGLSQALLGNIKLVSINGKTLENDQIIELVSDSKAGLDSEYLANAIFSLQTSDVNKEENNDLQNDLSKANSYINKLKSQIDVINQEISELQKKFIGSGKDDVENDQDLNVGSDDITVEELEKQLEKAIALKKEYEKLSESLSKQATEGTEPVNDLSGTEENFNDSNEPEVSKAKFDQSSNTSDYIEKFLEGSDSLEQANYDPREFYVTAGLDESSQAVRILPDGTSEKIPNITTSKAPILSGLTFSDALVSVYYVPKGSPLDNATKLDVVVNSDGKWSFTLPINNVGSSEFDYKVVATRSGEDSKEVIGSFKFLPLSSDANTSEGFTAEFPWEKIENKVFSSEEGKLDYQLVGVNSTSISGVAPLGSEILINVNGASYVFKVPIDTPVNSKGLGIWSFDFGNDIAPEFKDKDKYLVEVSNTSVINEKITLPIKKFIIDSSKPYLEAVYSGYDSFGYDSSDNNNSKKDEKGARPGFADLGSSLDGITNKLEDSSFIIRITKDFLKDSGNSLKLSFNGKEDYVFENPVSKEINVNGETLKIDEYNISLGNLSVLSEGTHTYTLTAINKLGSVTSVSKGITVDTQSEYIDTSLADNTDTAVTKKEDGTLVLPNGNEIKGVSNANEVPFITSNKVDNITTNLHPVLSGKTSDNGDYIRITIKKASISDEIESAAESHSSSTNRVYQDNSFNSNSVTKVNPDVSGLTEEEANVVRERAELDYQENLKKAKELSNITHQNNQLQPDIHTLYFRVVNGEIKSVEGKRPLTEDDKDRLTVSNGVWKYKVLNIVKGDWIVKVDTQDLAGNVGAKVSKIKVLSDTPTFTSLVDGDPASTSKGNPKLGGKAIPGSYIIIEILNQDDLPAVYNNGTFNAVDEGNEISARRATITDQNGVWSIPYLADRDVNLPPGNYKYKIQVIDPAGNTKVQLKEFEITAPLDTSNSLGDTILNYYDNTGTLDSNHSKEDSAISRQDSINTEKFTGAKNGADESITAMAVFSGIVLNKDNEKDTQVTGNNYIVNFKVYLDVDGTKSKSFTGKVQDGEWTVSIPKEDTNGNLSLPDGIYSYEVSIFNSDTGTRFAKNGNFIIDREAPDLDLIYRAENNNSSNKLGNIFKQKLYKVYDENDPKKDQYDVVTKEDGSKLFETDGFVFMLNNPDGYLHGKTDNLSKIGIVFYKKDGTKLDTVSVTSDTSGNFKLTLPNEIKAEIASNTSGNVYKTTFEVTTVDWAGNERTFIGGLFYSNRSQVQLEKFGFGYDQQMHNVPESSTSNIFTSKGTSDWGVPDSVSTSDRNPSVTLAIKNIYVGFVESNGFQIVSKDGMSGIANVKGNKNIETFYDINAHDKYKSATSLTEQEKNNAANEELSNTFELPEYSSRVSSDSFSINANLKDGFGNDITTESKTLKFYNKEVEGTLVLTGKGTGSTNLYSETLTPGFSFSINKKTDGAATSIAEYTKYAWLKVSIDGKPEKIFTFSENNSILNLTTQDLLGVGNSFKPGVNSIKYTFVDAWGNETVYNDSIRIKTDVMGLSIDTNSGSKNDNVTNFKSPKIDINSGDPDNVSSITVYINGTNYIANRVANTNKWTVDLSNATELNSSKSSIVALEDGNYSYTATVNYKNSSPSSLSDILIIDTKAPTFNLDVYSNTNPSKAYPDSIIHGRDLNNGSFRFFVSKDTTSVTMKSIIFPNGSVEVPLSGDYAIGSYQLVNSILEKHKTDKEPVQIIVTARDKAGNATEKVFDFYDRHAGQIYASLNDDYRPQIETSGSNTEIDLSKDKFKEWNDSHFKLNQLSGEVPLVPNGKTSTKLNLYALPGTWIKVKNTTDNVDVEQSVPKSGLVTFNIDANKDYKIIQTMPTVYENEGGVYSTTFKAVVESNVSSNDTVSIEPITGEYKESENKKIVSTSKMTPSITGKTSSNALVKLTFNGSKDEYLVRADSSGNWKYTPGEDFNAFNVGYNSVSVRTVSISGRVSNSIVKEFYIETYIPELSAGFTDSDNNNQFSFLFTKQDSVNITGKIDNSIVKLELINITTGTDTKVFVAEKDNSGNWTVNTGSVTINVSDGNFNINNIDTSSYLNRQSFKLKALTSTGAEADINLGLLHDTVVPDAPTEIKLNTVVDGSTIDNKTDIRQVIIQGKSSDSTNHIKLTINSKEYITTVENGIWSIAVDKEDVSEGSNSTKIKAIDLSGNESSEELFEFTYSSNLLEIEYKFPSGIEPSENNLNEAIHVGNNKKFKITGVIKDSSNNNVADANVTVTINGKESVITTGNDGSFTYEDTSDRLAGIYNFNIKSSKDSSASLVQSGKIIYKSNALLTVGGLSEESDSGIVGDNATIIKESSRLSLEGKLDNFIKKVKISISANDGTYSSEYDAVIKDGYWKFDLSNYKSGNLDVGNYKYKITSEITDDANSKGLTTPAQLENSFIIISPDEFSVTAKISDNNGLVYGEKGIIPYLVDKSSSKLIGTVSGGADISISLQKKVNGIYQEVNKIKPSISGDGTWSVDLGDYSSGLYKAVITATDGVNTKNEELQAVIALGKPETTIHLSKESDLGPSNTDGKTSLLYTPTLQGETLPGAVVIVKSKEEPDQVYYTHANEDGVWSVGGIVYRNGQNNFTAKVVDINGTESDEVSYTFDINNIDIPIIYNSGYETVDGKDYLYVYTNMKGLAYAKAYTKKEDGTIEKIVLLDSMPLNYTEETIEHSNSRVKAFKYKMQLDLDSIGVSDKNVYVQFFTESEYGNFSETTSEYTIFGFSAEPIENTKLFNGSYYVTKTDNSISGKSQPNAEVSLKITDEVGNSAIHTINANSSGEWTYEHTNGQNGKTYTYEATNSNGVSRVGKFTVQTNEIALKDVSFIEIGKTVEDTSSDKSSNTGDGKNYIASKTAAIKGKLVDYSDSTKVVTGTVTIEVSFTGSSNSDTKKFITNTNEKGEWTIVVSGLDESGKYNYSVSAESHAGKEAESKVTGLITVSESTGGNITVDELTDDIPKVESNSYRFSGALDKSSTIIFSVYDNINNNVIYSVKKTVTITDENRIWEVDVPTTVFPYGKTNYKYEVYTVGNEEGKQEGNFNIKSAKFKLTSTIDQSEGYHSDLGFVPTQGYVGVKQPTFKGTSAPNASIKISLTKNGESPINIETKANALGEWTVKPSSDISDGTYNYTIKQSGLGADESSSLTGTINVLTDKPTFLQSDIVNGVNEVFSTSGFGVKEDGQVNDSTPTVFGVVASGYTAMIEYKGKKYIAPTSSSGKFIFSLPVDEPLESGSGQYKLYSISPSGIISDGVEHTFTVDSSTRDSTKPVINLQSGSDKYIYNLEKPSNLTFKGTISESASITVSVYDETGSRLLLSNTIKIDSSAASTSWQVVMDGSSLNTDVKYKFIISAVDNSLNKSEDRNGEFVIPVSGNTITNDQKDIIDSTPVEPVFESDALDITDYDNY